MKKDEKTRVKECKIVKSYKKSKEICFQTNMYKKVRNT